MTTSALQKALQAVTSISKPESVVMFKDTFVIGSCGHSALKINIGEELPSVCLMVSDLKVFSNLPEEIELSKKGNSLHIKYKSGSMKLRVLDETSLMAFPRMGETVASTKISGASLKYFLGKATYLCVNDVNKEFMSGVGFKQNAIVSTNGHVLSESVWPVGLDCCIPKETANTIMKYFGDGEITITQDQGQIMFESTDVKLISPLLDAKFPDSYGKMIPESVVTSKVNRKDFIAAIRRSINVLDTLEEVNYIQLEQCLGELVVSVKEIFSESIPSDDAEFKFSAIPSQLLNVLTYQQSEEISLGTAVNAAGTCLVIKDQSNETVIIMGCKSTT